MRIVAGQHDHCAVTMQNTEAYKNESMKTLLVPEIISTISLTQFQGTGRQQVINSIRPKQLYQRVACEVEKKEKEE